ncbi:TraR/DksA C4-type zinc finger protein [Pseudomonas juntendi]|uniref:TraR/DksA C4-type zinc finger protein n=1 Tax=Pseudomonas juntendi TaxID=2666183 RepID=UPI002447B074|nr:TraR/DksA C4-type zinc finger protein [Pseudomonas juntendi]MDG9808591.1 TraR/DksA C4-type zinc finger protein [Pseudomonas juntendi]
MDVTDIATETEEAFREQALAARGAGRAHYTGPRITHCESCGDQIPTERSEILPGVELCVSCQEDIERMGGR